MHVLNYTNPAMHRGWLRAFYPIGEQRVRLAVPPSRKVTRVELLKAEKDVPFEVTGGRRVVHDPNVVDYEVAAIYSA